MVRKYELEYDTDPNTTGSQYSASTGRSLLTKVTQYDRTGTSASLPPITLSYQQPSNNVTETASGPEPPPGDRGNLVRTGDFDGDGRMDVFIYAHQNDGFIQGTWYLYRSNGGGFDPPIIGSDPPANGWQEFIPGDYTSINGQPDGKSDLFVLQSVDFGGGWQLWRSTGTGFSFVTSGTQPAYTQRNLVQTGDFDGDGFIDLLIYSHENDGENTPFWHLWRSTGSGFTEVASERYPIVNAWQQILPGDYTGDGKTDLFVIHSPDVLNGGWELWRSTGIGFTVIAGGPAPPNMGASNNWYRGRAGDFNGDGMTDVFLYSNEGNGYSYGTWRLWLATGNGFQEVKTRNNDPYANAWQNFVPADYNGDGKADLFVARSPDCCGASPGGWQLWRSTGTDFVLEMSGSGLSQDYKYYPGDYTGNSKADFFYLASGNWHLWATTQDIPDLLATTTNGLGGRTTVTYTPSTQYSNTQLPFAVQTVSSVTICDRYNSSTQICDGTSSRTKYFYSNGFYHIGERDFRGFNYGKVTVEPSGNTMITETLFHQGNDVDVDVNNPNVTVGYMKGKPYRVKVKDGSGNIYTETTTSYANDNTPPYFNPPLQVDTSICDGDTTCGKQTRVVYTYDPTYGNLTDEYHYGDLSVGTDDRTIKRIFSPNTTAWLVGFPANESIYEGIGTTNQVARTDFYYDGVTDCNTASTNQIPTKGHVTRVVRWLNGGTSPETRMAYDAYGNLICTRDANGHTTTISYDSSFTFAKVITNPLAHSTTTQYYGVDGVAADKGLYGQVKSVTDANGHVTIREYDSFGRLILTTNPPDDTNLYGQTSLYGKTYKCYMNMGNPSLQRLVTYTLNQGEALPPCGDLPVQVYPWTEEYFDGLGRTYKVRSRGPDVKIIQVDTIYNSRGQVAQTSLPYFVGESPRFRTFTYDAVGRVTQIQNPDNTFTYTCYNDWVTVTIDANNHRKRETRDAYGRLKRVDEYQGTYPPPCTTAEGSPYATTSYDYDVLGNLRFVTDHLGNVTEMRYDTLSRKIYMKDPDMGVWTYAYDGVGNLLQQTDAKGQTILFSYDKLNRLVQKVFR